MAEQRLVQQGFTSIEVGKEKLLEIIKTNKEKHIAEYKKAVVAYEIAKLAYAQEFWAQFAENLANTKKILDDKLESVAAAVIMAREVNSQNDGSIDLKNINISVNYNLQPKVQMTVQAPISHEKDYSIAIMGLELSTAEFVFLDQSNFSKYVLDEWDWKPTFATNISALTTGTSLIGNSYFSNNLNGVYYSGCSSIMPLIGSGISITASGCSNPFGTTYSSNEFDFLSDSIEVKSMVTESSNLGANSMALFNDIFNSTKGEK